MKKNNSKTAALIKKIAGKAATAAGGTASWWGMYQTKEPKMKNKA